jgi:nitrite reductase (NO-forming)
LPVIEGGRPRVAISRAADRRITFVGLLVAAGFLAAALLGLAHLVVGRTGLWIPLHLALAGGASTAVAAVLPFFTAALAAAAPVDPRIRGLGLGGVAGGALVVSLAVPTGLTAAAVLGGLAYVVGIGSVALAALLPLRGALGVRRPLIEAAYALALAQVGVGALLAISLVAGIAPIAERWALLKPAHGWLNVFGFLTVVIAATLVHLTPTVVGARIRPRRSTVVAIVGLVVGAPLVAAGLAVASDAVVRAGAGLEIVGATALCIHGLAVHRDRGRWTTDRDWHRLTAWSLLLAPAWLLVAVVAAAGPLLWLGADPAAWSIGRLAAPLAIGFVGQVLVGSWSHLVPAIGPGDQAAHARQRHALGRLAMARIAALDSGALLATVGAVLVGSVPMIGTPLIALGLVLAGGSLVTSIALLAGAARVGRPVLVAATAS